MQIKFEKLKISKKKLFKVFYKKGIILQVHYIPIFFQKFYKKNFQFNTNEFKNCIDFYKKEVSIPMYRGLSINQVKHVTNNILNIDKLK